MKAKYYLILIFLSAIILIFTACNNGRSDEMNIPEEFVQGFTVDNSKPLASVLTKTYKLHDLRSFFGQISPNESLMYGKHDVKSLLNINHVNERFPIECLRKAESMSYYVVYKVNEGGYFYVFWSLCVEPLPEKRSEYSIKNADNASVYFTAYLSPSSLRKASDFDSITENLSTAEDVSQIDSALEISFLMSSGIRSYSLLENGSVMEIGYKNSDKIESRKDLIVTSKNLLSKNIASTASHLASIHPKDLP